MPLTNAISRLARSSRRSVCRRLESRRREGWQWRQRQGRKGVEKLRRRNRIQERILSNEVPSDWIWTRPNFLMTCPQRKEGLLTEQLLKLCWKQNILQMAMPSLAACCTAPRQRRYRGISCLIISTAKKGQKNRPMPSSPCLYPWQLRGSCRRED